MNIELLIDRIATVIGVSKSEKDLAYELFVDFIVKNISSKAAMKIPDIGVFQLSNQNEDTSDESNNLIFSPFGEDYIDNPESKFLTIDISGSKKDEIDFDEKIFSIGIGKPILPLSSDDEEDEDTTLIALKKSIEEKISEIISKSIELENFDLLSDYLSNQRTNAIIGSIDNDESKPSSDMDFSMLDTEQNHSIELDANRTNGIIEEIRSELNEENTLDEDISSDSQEINEKNEDIESVDEETLDEEVPEYDSSEEDPTKIEFTNPTDKLEAEPETVIPEIESETGSVDSLSQDIPDIDTDEKNEFIIEDTVEDIEELDYSPESIDINKSLNIDLDDIEIIEDEFSNLDDSLSDAEDNSEAENTLNETDNENEILEEEISEEEVDDWGGQLEEQLKDDASSEIVEDEEDTSADETIEGTVEESNIPEVHDEAQESDISNDTEQESEPHDENVVDSEEELNEETIEDIPEVESSESIEGSVEADDEKTDEQKSELEVDESVSGASEEEESKKKTLLKPIIISVAVFIVITILGVYYFFLSGDEKSQEAAINQDKSTQVVDQTKNEKVDVPSDDKIIKDEGKESKIKSEPIIDVNKQQQPVKAEGENKAEITWKYSKATDEGLYRKIKNETKVNNTVFFDGARYNLQVSSWRNASTAEKEANTLRQKGYDAFISEVYLQNLGGTWYRVKIGYFKSINEAQIFEKRKK